MEQEIFAPTVLTTLSLEALAHSPDCGNWMAAILLRSRHSPWRRWSVEHALSTVDQQLRINSAYFVVQPPPSWEEACDMNSAIGLTAQRVRDEGLMPSTAFRLMNKVFGSSTVHLGGRFDWEEMRRIEAAAGIKVTWTPAADYNSLGQTLRFDIDENSSAIFYCNSRSTGSLLQRAESAAQSFVRAARARQKMVAGLVHSVDTGRSDLLGM